MLQRAMMSLPRSGTDDNSSTHAPDVLARNAINLTSAGAAIPTQEVIRIPDDDSNDGPVMENPVNGPSLIITTAGSVASVDDAENENVLPLSSTHASHTMPMLRPNNSVIAGATDVQNVGHSGNETAWESRHVELVAGDTMNPVLPMAAVDSPANNIGDSVAPATNRPSITSSVAQSSNQSDSSSGTLLLCFFFTFP